jgi:ornithine carbamoyltransferase
MTSLSPRPETASSRSGATHVLRGTDLGAEAIRGILAEAADLKAALRRDPAATCSLLRGRSLVMLFEKPSLRTRVSFEIGMAKLGGTAVHLDHRAERLGVRESVADYARNLERWCDVVVARVFEHATLEQLAEASSVPVVNALSERFHPCQALADLLTLAEHGRPLGEASIAFVGDGNNVCHSLMETVALLGGRFVAITPESCRPDAQTLAECREIAAASGAEILWSEDPAAVSGADAIYTDAWISMGQTDAQEKRTQLEPYRVDPALMRKAGSQALFMHCLPAHRGEEVLDEVIDSPASVVYDQAENRMHAQNALLVHLIGRG